MPRVCNWLRQWDYEDLDLAIRLLEEIDYYSHSTTIDALKRLGSKIKKETNGSFGNTYFCGFTNAGKSGEWITSDFRFANNLKSTKYDNNFIFLSSMNDFQIMTGIEKAPPKRFFVFLDDYIGTGHSAIGTWQNIQSSANDSDQYILATIVTSGEGYEKVTRIAPDLKLIYDKIIPETCKIFHPRCTIFSPSEKTILRKYCMMANPIDPTGFGDLQSLVVFYQRIADNVISILNCRREGIWKPLFPRDNYDDFMLTARSESQF
jgi:hypothetical protein